MTQYIVWLALTFKKSDIKKINSFFKKNNWGSLSYKSQWKTTGGRNDVLFLYRGKGDEVGKFSVGRFRMGGISWLGDYVNNNKNIISLNTLSKLRTLVKKTGDYSETEDDI